MATVKNPPADVGDAPVSKTEKVVKRCPNCNATIFQGPTTRGPIEDGEYKPRETLYTCVQCHRVAALEELEDYAVPVM